MSQWYVIGYVNDRVTQRLMSLGKSDWINILQNTSHVGIISLWGISPSCMRWMLCMMRKQDEVRDWAITLSELSDAHWWKNQLMVSSPPQGRRQEEWEGALRQSRWCIESRQRGVRGQSESTHRGNAAFCHCNAGVVTLENQAFETTNQWNNHSNDYCDLVCRRSIVR